MKALVLYTHTHTHTSNLKKEEKRVGENPTLKGMEKDGQKKGEIFLTACLFCVLYTEKQQGTNSLILNKKQKEYKKEGVENV